MADIFVSYSRKDRARVLPFIAMLEDQGWDVWWDKEIDPGASFRKEIEKEISDASCVIVFWSSNSVDSDWVTAEASEGLDRHILVPIQLEETNLPLVFRQTQTADLSSWPDKPNTETLEHLFEVISGIISRPVTRALKTNKVKYSPWRAPWVRALVVISFLALTTYMMFYFNIEKVAVNVEPSNNGLIRNKPVATINLTPIRNMQSDITHEINKLLSQSKGFLISMSDDNNKFPEQSQYRLQGVQSGNSLILSLFDNETQQTRLNIDINLSKTSLNRAAQIIANRVAKEFDQPAVTSKNTVPNDIYIRYLRAGSLLRQPPTDETLTSSISSFTSIVADAPRFSEAQAGLCTAYIRLYRATGESSSFEKAEKHCFRAARLADSNPNVKVALAVLYKTSGQLQESEELYKNALTDSPYLTTAIVGLAAVKAAQENFDEAVSLYKQAQQQEPNHWKNYADLAALYFRQGQYKQAVDQYLIAKGLLTNQSLVLNDLGAAYFMAEDFDNAIANWEMSLNFSSSYSVLSNLGTAEYFSQHFDKALDYYKKAIHINNHDYRMWLNAGEAAYHNKENAEPYYQKAIELARAQLAINPDKAEVISALALCYASAGQKAKATTYLNKALKIAGNDIYVLYDIAVTYSRLGNNSDMATTIQKMISNGYPETLIQQDANF